MIQRHVWVSGRVQGVGFRASTVREALRVAGLHGELKGFVRNLEDGRVEAVFAGSAQAVDVMLKWCEHGPSSAKVTHLEVKEEPISSSLSAFSAKL